MRIRPVKKLQGVVTVPGDKSISHRAVMLGAISKGRTRIKGLLDCDDCNYTIKAFMDMGVPIKQTGRDTVIDGVGLNGLKRPAGPINVGESGTSMRLLAGVLAGQDFEARVEGGSSLSARPMSRIIDPLSRMGVYIKSAKDGYPPIVIKGGTVRPIVYKTPIPSAQVKSAIMFAGLYAEGLTTVEETFKSRDHTERMMSFFGADVKVDGLKVSVRGGGGLTSKSLEIPGDISSAAFFLVGGSVIRDSKIRIGGVGINPTRSGILDVIARMGGKVKTLSGRGLFEPSADIEVESAPTHGIIINEDIVTNIIDELPAIFVLAALSEGSTVIKGAGELKVKETDRINSMKYNLQKMGARFETSGNSIMITGARPLCGAPLKSFGDHRTCMAMAVAALAAVGDSEIDDAACVAKSFPGFFETLDKLRR